ncbi:adenylosuccinate lyase, partial [Candidatus Peribacteria bacterium RIFCSPHIGHO2_01_FULL_51_9]
MSSPLSPLDGRYQEEVEPLRAFFTEEAFTRARILVEVSYFIALSQEKEVRELPSLSSRQIQSLWNLVEAFNGKEFQKIKKNEKKTRHDVKAIEYYLAEKVKKIPGLKKAASFIHFGLTSEDINNIAYGLLMSRAIKRVLLPSLKALAADLTKLAKSGKSLRLLSLTHGQPATPTTLEKAMLVFVDRLRRQELCLSHFKMSGKFSGAVGNFSAHKAAYPNVNWEKLSKKFIQQFGLDPLFQTTQINPHDDFAELSHIFCRIDTILLNLAQDIWLYISRGIFRQKTKSSEVGSSTMPHKVNPIDFENAEGNLGLASALFTHFAEKLPLSRLQRDLSDSTVQRNLGIAFGYHLLA